MPTKKDSRYYPSRRLISCGLPVALALIGCDAETADIGERGSEAGAGSATNGEEVWEGYLEAFEYPNGISDLTLSIVRTDSSVTGTVTFGDGPAPPVDPEVGYPPDTDDPLNSVVPGYPLTISNGTASGSRVRFSLDYAQQWTEWCGLQTSYRDVNANRYQCMPPGGTATGETCALILDSGEQQPIDCGKQQLCGYSACTCDATSCAPNSEWFVVDLDLYLSGTEGDGTIPYYDSQVDMMKDVTVRLQRVQ